MIVSEGLCLSTHLSGGKRIAEVMEAEHPYTRNFDTLGLWSPPSLFPHQDDSDIEWVPDVLGSGK